MSNITTPQIFDLLKERVPGVQVFGEPTASGQLTVVMPTDATHEQRIFVGITLYRELCPKVPRRIVDARARAQAVQIELGPSVEIADADKIALCFDAEGDELSAIVEPDKIAVRVNEEPVAESPRPPPDEPYKFDPMPRRRHIVNKALKEALEVVGETVSAEADAEGGHISIMLPKGTSPERMVALHEDLTKYGGAYGVTYGLAIASETIASPRASEERREREAPLVELVKAVPEGLDPIGWRAAVLAYAENLRAPMGPFWRDHRELVRREITGHGFLQEVYERAVAPSTARPHVETRRGSGVAFRSKGLPLDMGDV